MKNGKKKARTKHDKLNTQIRQLEADRKRLLRDIADLEAERHRRSMNVFALTTRESLIKRKIDGFRDDIRDLRNVLNRVEI